MFFQPTHVIQVIKILSFVSTRSPLTLCAGVRSQHAGTNHTHRVRFCARVWPYVNRHHCRHHWASGFAHEKHERCFLINNADNVHTTFLQATNKNEPNTHAHTHFSSINISCKPVQSRPGSGFKYNMYMWLYVAEIPASWHHGWR